MDYAKTLIIETNVGRYENSIDIGAEYGIITERVDDIEQALKEAAIYKYHLIIIGVW